MSHLSGCIIMSLVSAFAITGLGFYFIFQDKRDNENDVNVLQRQLKGFGLLYVAMVVYIIGVALCVGNTAALQAIF